ncbi:MAG: hypothetical protein MK295_04355, partial [Pseudomonadales bacterium]|nr:hypothetical protein [Pseudomonadales bacterium]
RRTRLGHLAHYECIGPFKFLAEDGFHGIETTTGFCCRDYHPESNQTVDRIKLAPTWAWGYDV